MASFEVDPGQLSGGAGSQQQLAAEIATARSALAAAIASGAAGAGEAGAAAALNGCAMRLGSALDLLAEALVGYGGNLGAAADAYARTDASAMGGGG
jgi:hypothetical protein